MCRVKYAHDMSDWYSQKQETKPGREKCFVGLYIDTIFCSSSLMSSPIFPDSAATHISKHPPVEQVEKFWSSQNQLAACYRASTSRYCQKPYIQIELTDFREVLEGYFPFALSIIVSHDLLDICFLHFKSQCSHCHLSGKGSTHSTS